ncbi:MAG: lipid II flippase Amj family protein [Chitinispirillaceae bacterium]|nr:lipid II flippase Amj family protein [Chitinispirillaceae bacterium]
MIDPTLLLLILLTFIIHLIGTLSYAARMAGVRMRRIAVSFSLFNILVLFSRIANTFQQPLLAKRIETAVAAGIQDIPTIDFRLILIASTVATIAGTLLIPTFQRAFGKLISRFSIDRSLYRVLLYSFTKTGIRQLKDTISIPRTATIQPKQLPPGILPILLVNIAGTGIWTVGVLSSLYAAYLVPELRVTAGSLAAVVNGVATLLMFIVVDPYMSLLTDDVFDIKIGEPSFRSTIVLFAGSRLLGTLFAQLLLVPAAHVIAVIAQIL